MFCGSVGCYLGRSVGRYLGRSLPWSGGMLFGWGFSRSREVRLEHGGFTEQGERSGEHGGIHGGRLEDALLFYLSMLL